MWFSSMNEFDQGTVKVTAIPFVLLNFGGLSREFGNCWKFIVTAEVRFIAVD